MTPRIPRYVLAQFENQVELIIGTFPENTTLGYEFVRQPLRQEELWKVIKIFSFQEHHILDAFITLAGAEVAQELFRFNL